MPLIITLFRFYKDRRIKEDPVQHPNFKREKNIYTSFPYTSPF